MLKDNHRCCAPWIFPADILFILNDVHKQFDKTPMGQHRPLRKQGTDGQANGVQQLAKDGIDKAHRIHSR